MSGYTHQILTRGVEIDVIQQQRHKARWRDSRTPFEMAVLTSVFLLVIGGLWFRHTRSAAASLELDSRLSGANRLEVESLLTRAEFRKMEVGPTLDKIEAIRDPVRIRKLLPVGSQYDVVVKGGVVATRTGNLFVAQSRPNLAYAFDMSYRRIIEFNDGHRVVERRSFAVVRMAKILSSTSGMTLASVPAEQLFFRGIQFPPIDEGITIGPASLVSKSMLFGDADSVPTENSMLCQLQRHPLHGKSVRLTYVDGIGVESVEPLGCGLTLNDMPYFFRQNVLPVFTDLDNSPNGTKTELVTTSALLTFCDPTKPASMGFEWQLRSTDNASGTAKTYFLEQLQRADPSTGLQLPVPAVLRRGTLQTDPSGAFVADAIFHWQHSELEGSRSSLMFDQPFFSLVGDPVFSVQYHCRKLEDVRDGQQ